MAAKIKLTDQFKALYQWALHMAKEGHADAVLLLLDGPTDWEDLHAIAAQQHVFIAADTQEQVLGAANAGFPVVLLGASSSPVYERLTQSLLECVADDLLAPGATVAALYSGFEAGEIDSVSIIRLHEHLGRLTVRDLRQLETRVPLDTLKLVVDLAVDIGREGREGKPVGTIFVVGDHRRVLKHCHPVGFDPVRGYSRQERNLDDPKVREGIKEIAQMDGAFVIASDRSEERRVGTECRSRWSPYD